MSHVCWSGWYFFFWDHKFLLVCSQLFIRFFGNHRSEKLFTCLFLLTWPRPPILEGTLLQAFPFLISFFWVLLFLFHFQPTYISSNFKRPFFLLWFWLQQSLFFQHLSLNLEILMPKIMMVFPLILNHLVLQHQIIEILSSSPTSSVKEHSFLFWTFRYI